MNLIIVSQTILTLIIVLTPLFFTTLTSEYYATGKEALLFFSIPLLILVVLVNQVKEKKVEFAFNKLTLPVIALSISSLISTLFASPNKIESIFTSTGAGVFIALGLLFLVITVYVKKKETVIYPLIGASSALAILYVLQFFKVTAILFPVDFITQNPFWTPAGTLISLAIILLVSIPLAVETALNQKSEQGISTILGWIATVVISLGFIFTVVSIVKDAKPPILPFSYSWSIAIDTMRSVGNAFVGVGPGNFVDAFTRSKPIEINNSQFWSIRFGTAGGFILNLLTELGAIGLFFYLFTILIVVSSIKKNITSGLFISLVFLFAAFTFLPATTITLFILFVLLGTYSTTLPTMRVVEHSNLFPKLLLGIWIVSTLAIYWFSVRWFLGEYYFQRSIISASNNQGLETYDNQIKAIDYSPWNERFRIAYSQTNIALASAISQNENPSDQDRQNITVLIQQAIREAKVATSLNPRRASNWENLAGIYQSILNATDSAGEWTLTSLNQAIQLDPLNPGLRIGLGGILYQLQNYDGAIQQFTIAVNLKPDYANAYYNLAAAYKEKGEFEQAFAAMQNVLALVDPNSNDFNKASAELEEIRAMLPQTQTQEEVSNQENPETLTNPGSLPVDIKPTIELTPEDAAPVVPEETNQNEQSEIEQNNQEDTNPTPNI